MDILINFGALGLLAYLIAYITKDLSKVVKNNTEAVERLEKIVSSCKYHSLVKK